MDSNLPQPFIEEIFSAADDWRVERCKRHQLVDILFLSLCGMISGADGFSELEEFGKERLEWLRQYVPLKHGIPSHDTIRRIFMQMDPEIFAQCFHRWMSEMVVLSEGQVISLDGKQLRGMKDVGSGRYGFYLVGAWAHENGLCLAQEKVDEKSNEITALPQVLSLLDIKDQIVTIDAMGTQRAIAEQIIEQGGAYILAVKENQGRLYEEIVEFFEEEAKSDFLFVETQKDQSWDKGHGRIEQRICHVAYDVETLSSYNKWRGLQAIIQIQASRWIHDKMEQKTRYYIASYRGTAKQLNMAIRSHWGIENSLHWILDVVFHEDQSRIRTDHAPQNMALLRKMALNMIKANKGKFSVKTARLKAAWNPKVLQQLVFGN